MIKTALVLCLGAAYLFATFGFSMVLGSFIRYHENA